MKRALFLVFLLAAVSFAQETEADAAQFLLEDLYRDAQKSLKDLQDTWAINGGLLQDTVNSWETTFNDQTAQCQNRDAIVDDANAQQQENERLIQWISETTRVKYAKYNKLYDDRCASNRNYISGLKNDKILLRLIDFLRQALTNVQSMSLIQKREFAQILMQFMALYKNNDTKQLLQLHAQLQSQDQATNSASQDEADYDIDNQFDTQQRTDEEIGTGHVDDGRAQIDLDNFNSNGTKSFEEYRAELLTLLADLESQILQKVGNSQEDEVAAGIATAEYRLQIEKEFQELDAKLYEQTTFSITIARRITEVSGKAVQCHKQLVSVTEAYQSSQDSYNEAFTKFSEKQTSLNEELEVFQYVLDQYTNSVSSDASYRNQIEDYTEDGQYDDSYNGREVDQIDFVGENAN